MRVMVALHQAPPLVEAAIGLTTAPEAVARVSEQIPGLDLDTTFPLVALQPQDNEARSVASSVFAVAAPASAATFVVRGSIPDEPGEQAAAVGAALSDPRVAGVFSDPTIETCLVCAGSPPQGTSADVAALLDVPSLGAAGLDGTGVPLAVVDTGVNLNHLNAQGVALGIDLANSWTPVGVGTAPGAHPVGHGTMCAFDAAIAAPNAEFLDHAVLLSSTPGATVMEGLLSDAVVSYGRILTYLSVLPRDQRRMVVTNSWGMFNPAWDFPIGHPGNYSDNAQHPFNIIVRSLAAAGADVLFAAGNCGRDCPDGRCSFQGTLPICGANSHPSVLSIAGVDTSKQRVGYSSQGPGRLSRRKPSLCGYTHFSGSQVYAADGGTSAACPVIAGLVAAIRTRVSSAALPPMRLRSVLYKTAQDLGPVGFDFDHGWGVPDTAALLNALQPVLGVGAGV